MHPRTPRTAWPKARWAQAHAVLDFVRERGVVHPREVDAQFAHGKVTQLVRRLEQREHAAARRHALPRPGAHRRGATAACACTRRASRRRRRPTRQRRMDALVDVVVRKYAPLPARSLGELVSHLRARRAAVGRRAPRRAGAREAAPAARHASTAWTGTGPTARTRHRRATRRDDAVRLLAPFDPVVWDRRRFELFWGWAYRFEAYTPAPKRVRGYYALPLLWRDRVIGWGNLAVDSGRLVADDRLRRPAVRRATPSSGANSRPNSIACSASSGG